MHDITLKAMRFHASVGILPHEREAAQSIEIDLTVRVSDSERTSDIVDYRALYDIVTSTLRAGHIDFLEEIANRIATGALAYSSRIRSTRVAVRKPHVALGGPLAYAEVVTERSAGD